MVLPAWPRSCPAQWAPLARPPPKLCMHPPPGMQGGSFMLHQIRHMVAMAVAVARGQLPLELLDASLATPARLNLPLAPPSTLMLMDAQFRWGRVSGGRRVGRPACPTRKVEPPPPARPSLRLASPAPTPSCSRSAFKRSYSGDLAAAAAYTGDTLELRKAGAAARGTFLQAVMLPALDALLAGQEWEEWGADLERMRYDPDALRTLLAAHADYQEQRAAARLEGMLEEAAALEQRGDE